MSSGAKEKELKLISLNAVNKQPIRFYVTFTKALIVSSQAVVAIFNSQWFFSG